MSYQPSVALNLEVESFDLFSRSEVKIYARFKAGRQELAMLNDQISERRDDLRLKYRNLEEALNRHLRSAGK